MPFLDKNGVPLILELGVITYPNGHTASVSAFPVDQSGGIMDDYKATLMKKYGGDEAKVREVLHQKVHSSTLFPTFDLLTVQNSLRVVIPKAVDYTEVRAGSSVRNGTTAASGPATARPRLATAINTARGLTSCARRDESEFGLVET